ncbi:hypothetical protein IJG78_00010 [Candidatus Saccharibacteria bacterium]|nr:hypothetical protein [Candidatus Saccharibacteria bacterium]
MEENIKPESLIARLSQIRSQCKRNIITEFRSDSSIESARHQGYSDAYNHHAEDFTKMTHEDMEANRISAIANIEYYRQRIVMCLHASGEVSFLMILRKYILAFLIPISAAVSIAILRLWPIIVILALTILSYALQGLFYLTVGHILYSAYYDHGFAEAVSELADWREIMPKTDLSKPI